MMMTRDELFEDGWESFHDVFYQMDITKHENLSLEQLKILFDALPETTRDIAHCWSLGDTVFRDEAYTFYHEKKTPDEVLNAVR